MGISPGGGVVLWSQACSFLPAAACSLGPGQLEVPFSASLPWSSQPQPPALGPPRPGLS